MIDKNITSILYSKVFHYTVDIEIFNSEMSMSHSLNQDFPYDFENFYASQISNLISELTETIETLDDYNAFVSQLSPIERPIVLDFISWLRLNKDATFMTVYSSFSYNNDFPTFPLDNIVEYVKTLPNPSLSVKKEELSESIQHIFHTIKHFTSISSSLTKNGRRKGHTEITIDDEYDVQDLLHVMLKPRFPKIREEVPVDGMIDHHFLKIDFLLSDDKIAIECKFNKGKNINDLRKQIADDIMIYSKHFDCENLIFFVYDKELLITNPNAFEQDYTQSMRIGDKELQIYLLVQPQN